MNNIKFFLLLLLVIMVVAFFPQIVAFIIAVAVYTLQVIGFILVVNLVLHLAVYLVDAVCGSTASLFKDESSEQSWKY